MEFSTLHGESPAQNSREPNSPVSAADNSPAASGTTDEPSSAHKLLRRNILEIQKNTLLTPIERARMIQNLMTATYHRPLCISSSSTPNSLDTLQKAAMELKLASSELGASITVLDLAGSEVSVQQNDLEKSWFDESSKKLGCPHYQRGARFQAICCGRWYVCRFCHDQAEDHQVVRNATVDMICMDCNQVQPIAKSCAKCSTVLGAYFCDLCKLWDNDLKKSIFHCDKCKLCRIGEGLGIDYFHCDLCNVCMVLSMRGHHRCIERNLESDCPICGEFMFTSKEKIIFMPCGHCIHLTCHEEYIKNSYQCPICWKSLADMSSFFNQLDRVLAQQTMPPEYDNIRSKILCNDCEKKSDTKFHFQYHKCQECGSYNTKILSTFIVAAPSPTSEALSTTAVTSPMNAIQSDNVDAIAETVDQPPISPLSGPRMRSISNVSRDLNRSPSLNLDQATHPSADP